MKVSVFAPSDTAASEPPTLASVRPVLLIAALYFAAHLPSLAPSLEDIDSINFALGLRDFNPAEHQPHPPGYPVYIALGRTSLAVVAAVFPSMTAARAEALALSIWSALGGALAIVAAWFLFRALERFRTSPPLTARSRVASPAAAALLLAVMPLFWLTGSRPMSDMPGLAVVLVAQAFLLHAIQGRVSLVPGALATALAAGLRSQGLVLTVPLLIWGIATDLKTGWRVLVKPAIALLVGTLVWAIPLIVAAGGIDGYIRALGSQAGEDFAWVNMLWSNPTPRRLAFALYETFVLPWASIPLAAIIGASAAVGTIVTLARSWRALAVVGLAFGPYAIFHLLFQETLTVRYALPLVPAVAWLSVRATAAAGRPAVLLAIGLAGYAAVVSIPAGIKYGSEPHPAFRAIDDMAERSKAQPVTVFSHYSLFRPLQAAAPAGFKTVRPVRNYEWLGLVGYWRRGGTAPVGFLADPKRTDLALIDPQSRRERTEYRWAVADRPELQGVRPVAADWYRLLPPGWFAGEGWSLTPELGGLVRASGQGIDHRPLEAQVRRRNEPVTVMIGGHLLNVPTEPPIELTLSLEGSVIESWTFDPGATGRNFLRFIRLPSGIPAGTGDYARLTIAARSTIAGRPTPDLSIRQFDVQSSAFPILGYAEGWHEDEYDAPTGRRWKWTSNRAAFRIVHHGSVVLIVRGESPLRYFDAPPTVRVKAGDRVMNVFRPDADFEWRIKIPGDAISAAQGTVAIETDRVYVPSQVEGSPDQRPLGLRIFEYRVETDGR